VRNLPRARPERARADRGIAGRSPSYFVRQLYDFRHGARAAAGSALMKPTVEKLIASDMLSLAAYAASLQP
jgi:cytochrome c553